MRYRVFLFFALELALVIRLNAQGNEGYEITGNIKGLGEGEKVTMCMFDSEKEGVLPIRRDSAYVKNGVFHIKGYVPFGKRGYWLEFDHVHGKYGETVVHQGIDLVIDNNENITIRGDSNIRKIYNQTLNPYVTIEGSPTNSANQILIRINEMYLQSYFLNKRGLIKVKDSLGFNKSLIDGIMMARNGIDDSFYYTFLKNPEPAFEALIPKALTARFGVTDHPAFIAEVFNKLSEKIKNSYYGKRLKEDASLCVGQLLPEFSFPDSTGKRTGLKYVVTQSKVTLVHFWANNSVIRKEYDDELRAMYQLYHNKGLNIIGVSTDSYIDEWKDALQTEQYPWYNVIDLKGKFVDTVYHELGYPKAHNTTNVLLDGQGKIIAWDPTGVTLQWYLQQYLNDDQAKAMQEKK